MFALSDTGETRPGSYHAYRPSSQQRDAFPAEVLRKTRPDVIILGYFLFLWIIFKRVGIKIRTTVHYGKMVVAAAAYLIRNSRNVIVAY